MAGRPARRRHPPGGCLLLWLCPSRPGSAQGGNKPHPLQGCTYFSGLHPLLCLTSPRSRACSPDHQGSSRVSCEAQGRASPRHTAVSTTAFQPVLRSQHSSPAILSFPGLTVPCQAQGRVLSLTHSGCPSVCGGHTGAEQRALDEDGKCGKGLTAQTQSHPRLPAVHTQESGSPSLGLSLLIVKWGRSPLLGRVLETLPECMLPPLGNTTPEFGSGNPEVHTGCGGGGAGSAGL